MKFLAGFTLLAAVASAVPTGNPLAPREDKCQNPPRIISMVIDSSASNAFNDPNNVRLSGAIDVANYLNPTTDKIAVVSFDTKATVRYPLGAPGGAAAAISSIPASGGTLVSTGLDAGLSQLASAGADQRDRTGIVVFTDGRDDPVDGKPSTLALLAKAKAQGIRVSWGHLQGDYDKNKAAGKVSTSASTSSSTGVGGILSGILNIFLPGNGGGGSGGMIPTPSDSPPLDPDISAAVLATGGTAASIGSAQAQQAFIQQVLKNGLTNNDGKCGGLDGDESGGPIENEVTTNGLCSNNAQAVFTYTPSKTSEQLAVTVSLVSKSNPVTLTAVLENKVTGQRSQVVVNSANAAQILRGAAAPGQQVTVTVTPSGADDSQTCQYSVRLDAVADAIISSALSSAQITPSATPSTAQPSVVPTTSVQPSVVPTTSVQPSVVPTTSVQPSVVPTTSVQPSVVPTTSGQASVVPTTSGQASVVPTTSGQASVVPTTSGQASVVPTTSGQASVVPTTSGQASVVPTTSAAPSVLPSGPVVSCAAGSNSAIVSTLIQTTTVTVTATATGSAAVPSATQSVCICKCDVPGAKPFPKFEL